MRRLGVFCVTVGLLTATEPRQPKADAPCAELLHTLTGHSLCVYHAVFRPDGKELATSSKDKSVKLWDAACGKEVRTLHGHTGEIYSAAYSPDGKHLATAGDDRTVRLWDAAGGKELWTFKEHKGDVYHVAFSPDGRKLASASQDQLVCLWDAERGKLLRTLKGHTARVCTTAFSPDGRWIAACSPSTPSPDSGNVCGQIIVWEVGSGKEVLNFTVTDAGVVTLAFSPDGRRLAGACLDKTVKFWELATGREALCLQGHTLPVYHLAFRADGRCLASSSCDWSKRESGEVKLWELPSGREWLSFQPHTLPIWSVAFDPTGRRLATTAGFYDRKPGEKDTKGEVKIWELKHFTLAPPPVPTRAGLEMLWRELADADATRGYRAVWMLSAAPQQTVPFLVERVRPPKARDLEREIAQLIRELDDDNFAVRERAETSLEQLGRAARPALLKVKQSPSLEVRRRATQLLAKKDEGLPPLSAEECRDLRLVEIVLRIGTKEAKEVLRKLAKGDTKARATQEAVAALEWMESGVSRKSPHP